MMATPVLAAGAPELPQIVVVGRQDDARSPARVFRRAGRQEGDLVGLHGPPEIVELRILVEGAGIGRGGLRIRFGANDLRLALALGADVAGLLLPRRAHPVV